MMLRVRHDRGAELCLRHEEGPGPWGSGGWWVELGEECIVGGKWNEACTALLSSIIEYLITRDEKLNSICETVSDTTGSIALVDGSIACLCRVNGERAVAGGG